MSKSVLLIGATGLVGNLTLTKLLENDSIREVRIVTRRTTGIVHEKLKELVVDFELLKPFKAFMQCDVFINCLGSTRKKAGSKEAFERCDYFYPSKIAKICRENGASTMVLLSVVGADENSFFFYNRIKGKLENECKKIGFEHLIIIQPSIISGKRKGSSWRERFAKEVTSFFSPLLPVKYKPVSPETIANTIEYYTINECAESVQMITNNNFVR